MKIQYLSDLHLEFFYAGTGQFLASLVQEADVLVIAGDLGLSKDLYPAFKFLSPLYPHIVYVTGNHEYYHFSPQYIHGILEDCQKEFENLHWLNNSMIEIDGHRFLGGTGWFPDRPDNFSHKCRLSDFSCIQGFEPWVYESNKRFSDFLEDNLQKDDIVVMHHLPSDQSTPDFFRCSELNRFFVCDITDLILNREPSYVLHGHTHDSVAYQLENTKIICNPYGYVDLGINKNFKNNLILEV